MRHLSQLILFEKLDLFKRNSNCHIIKCSRQGNCEFFWHRNKQMDPLPLEKMNRPMYFFLASFKIDKLEPSPLCKIS